MKYTIDVSDIIHTTHRLKKDGTFKQFSGNHEKDILEDDFVFDNYSEAKYWKENQDFIDVDGKNIPVNPVSSHLSDPSVGIRPHRTRKPKQDFFTMDELRKVLLSGDDNYNNSLVVDFDGYLHLVPFKEAINRGYAVRYETFGAGNGYVGSESSLNHIKGTYLTLLSAWAIHLHSHNKVYKDYPPTETEEEIIQDIKDALETM
ncbi:hypothetical protein [Bacillus infantis]|uniref:hypothetical protein n=1 Tax=Bacillus infantis TaxID=324767 RepID=UPI003CEDA1DB